MAEKVDIIDIDLSKLEKETKDATKSVKELKKEVDGLQDTTDTSSKDLNNLAGILDKVSKNTDKATESFNDLGKINLDDKIESSEKLAENLGHVARIGAGLSGVFEIIQGGMNLMGVESEKMEEAMVKIQSLMAITQGLSAVGDSVESFQKLSKAIKESEMWTRLFTRSKKKEKVAILATASAMKADEAATKGATMATKGFKAALISTGIGALIVGLGIALEKLISNWDKFTGKVESKNLEDKFTPEAYTPYTEDEEYDLEQKYARMRAEGKSPTEIYLEQQVDHLKQIQKLKDDSAKEVKKLTKDKNWQNKLYEVLKSDIDFGNIGSIDSETRAAADALAAKLGLVPDGKGGYKLPFIAAFQPSKIKAIFGGVEKEIKSEIQRIETEISHEESQLKSDLVAENKNFSRITDKYNNEQIETKRKAREKSDEEAIAAKNAQRSKEEADRIAAHNKLVEDLEATRRALNTSQQNEINDLIAAFNERQNILNEALANELITQEEYDKRIKENQTKANDDLIAIHKKYADEAAEIARQKQQALIDIETARYRTADSNLYGKYVGDITDAEDKGYAYEAGSSRLEYLKEQNTLLEEHKNKLIELKATEEQLAEVDAMIAENIANQNAAEKEMWQGRLDGMNLLLDATISAADSIIGVSDTISGAWTNAFSVMQDGINQLGVSLQKGEKGWQTWANVAGSAISTASAIMMALADQNDESGEEGFNKEKKFQTAAAVMNTLAGIVAATTSAMSPMNAWMTLPGQIAMAASTSAMIAALGGVQIAKIKQQQFEGGGETPNAGNISPSASALSQIASPVNVASLVEGASTEGKVKDTRVYVTETDISSTQDKIRVAETEATY